jgi:CubicO group peptidase (beta-lactamase class C family)
VSSGRSRCCTDARLRIQSNSKAWAMAVIVQLAKEGKLALDDTVEQWLPGLLPYGGEITIRQLMTDTSGLIDDNMTEAVLSRYLARVKDAKLREQLVALLKALLDNRLGIRQQVLDFFGASGSNGPGWPGDAFIGTGAGAASRS